MSRRTDFKIKPDGFKNTEFTRQRLDPRAQRALRGAEQMEGMAETAAERGDVEGGLELLDRAARLRNRN